MGGLVLQNRQIGIKSKQVNFLVEVLTVVILSEGTVEPFAYGEVPASVATT